MLGEVRALIPTKVPLVALTATADAIQTIVKTLAMYTVEYITELPDRPNIKYNFIKAATTDYDQMFNWLPGYLIQEGSKAERIIVFCRTVAQCRELYAFVDSEVDLQRKPFAMYHSETNPDIQREVVASFAQSDGVIRCLFSTVAFGMGVDCKGTLYTLVFQEMWSRSSRRVGEQDVMGNKVTRHF